MVRRTVLGVLVAAVAALSLPALACAQEAEVRMPLDQLRKRLAKGGTVVVDVRSEAAWSEGHIPGAVSIPIAQFPSRIGELRKASTVVAYCA
jgi:rhodanese-related sulfurtransferase